MLDCFDYLGESRVDNDHIRQPTMKYEITIDRPVEGNGHIDFRRLAQLADVIAELV